MVPVYTTVFNNTSVMFLIPLNSSVVETGICYKVPTSLILVALHGKIRCHVYSTQVIFLTGKNEPFTEFMKSL